MVCIAWGSKSPLFPNKLCGIAADTVDG
jgi:hypothetical protein